MSERTANRKGAALGAILVALAVAGLWFFLGDAPPEQAAKPDTRPPPAASASRRQRVTPPRQTSRLAEQPRAGAQPERSPDGELEIEVVSDGAPLPGAQVQIYAREPADLQAPLVHWSGWKSGETEADGRWVVPAAPGSYYVTARAEGLAPGYAAVVHPPGSAHTRVQLSLEAAAELRGTTVVKGTGDPVSLAEILLAPSSFVAEEGAPPETPEEESLVATSNESGEFQLSGLAPGRYRVEARAPGYVSAVLPSVPIPFGGRMTLELIPGAQIEGVVLRADGQPADGAKVLASGRDRGGTALSDDEGHFSLTVPAGTYAVSARRGEETGALEGEVRLGVGQRVQGLRLQLGAAAWLSGKLVREDGDPVPGARVEARSSQSSVASGTASTNESGAFSLPALPAGTYTLRVFMPHGVSFDHGPITVAAGEHTSVTLTYDPRGNLQCTVWDAQKHGVEEVRVQVSGLQPHAPNEPRVIELQTDAKGSVSFQELPAGWVRVQVLPDTRSPGTSTTEYVSEGSDSTCFLRLPLYTDVENGAVLVEGQVLLPSGPPPSVPMKEGFSRSAGPFGETLTDAQGRYRLLLPPGQYSLSASPEKTVRCGGSGQRRLQVETGQALDATILVTELREPDLRLQVLESSGEPARQVLVDVLVRMSYEERAWTDEKGRLDVCLTPQDWQHTDAPFLVVRSSDRARMAVLQDAAGQRDFTLRLLPLPTVRAHIVPPIGVPVRRVFVDFIPYAEPPTYEFMSDRIALRVPPGQTQLVFTVNGTMRTSVVLNLQPGEHEDLEVSLSPDASLRGRLVDAATRKPLADTSLSISGVYMTTSADGRFSFSHIPAGENLLQVYDQHSMRMSRRVKLLPGEVNDVGDIALPAE